MKYYSLDQLKSSRIQYDKNPPNFLIYIIMFVLVLLISIVILGAFTYKTEVVRTSGILTCDSKVQIQSQNGGLISEVYFYDGEYVNENDVLFKIDSTQVTASIIAIQNKIDFMEKMISNYELLIKKIEEVDVNEENEIVNTFQDKEFYIYFQNFINSYNQANANEYLGISLISAKNQVKNEYLQSYYQTKLQYEYDMIGNKGQIEAYNEVLKTYKTLAPKSGYINYSTKISKGVVLDNSIIGTISEKINNENSIIECYINVGHRNFVNLNDSVEIVISGLSQNKYGSLSGKIVEISNDSTRDSDGNVLFKLTIKPDDLNVDDIVLQNGQVGEIRIKYETISWLNWCLKKMGIIDK